MRWLDDAPESWESAPDNPPENTGRSLDARPVSEGLVVHDADSDSPGTYIYAQDGNVTLEDHA